MTIKVHFWSDDVNQAIEYYSDKLGFEVVHREPPEGDAAFCILGFGAARIMFGRHSAIVAPEARPDAEVIRLISRRTGSPGALAVYVETEDVRAHFHNARTRGASILEELWDAPWGLAQYSVTDPDGNIVTFHS